MVSERPLILVSNDDGIQAKGLRFLVETLKPLADLFVMAPDSARSGAGRSITSSVPVSYKLLHKEPGLTLCSCSGTPVDCVKMAFDLFFDARRPQLVVGGINHGNNATINAHYSGTMGVAFEGVQQGVQSVAFSLCNHADDADFSPLAPYLVRFTSHLLQHPLPQGAYLNVNFPNRPTFEGVRICRMARSRWAHEYERHAVSHRGDVFWLVGDCENLEPEATDTDSWALEHGYVAVTPTTMDVTDYGLMGRLGDWAE